MHNREHKALEIALRIGNDRLAVALEFDESDRHCEARLQDHQVRKARGEPRLAHRSGIGNCRDQRVRQSQQAPMLKDSILNGCLFWLGRSHGAFRSSAIVRPIALAMSSRA